MKNTEKKNEHDQAIFDELLTVAKIIDSWPPLKQEKYLKELLARKKAEGTTLYRNIVETMLTSLEGRKNFIKLVKSGEIHNL